jgi:phosphoribosylformylglycinamidine synthase
LGGSHLGIVKGWRGGVVPDVDTARHLKRYRLVHRAIVGGLVRSCHDLSEGGLGVSLAEMALGGRLGISVDVECICNSLVNPITALFSESNGRLVCEVPASKCREFESLLGDECLRLGSVTETDRLVLRCGSRVLCDIGMDAVTEAWLRPLDWR